MILARSSSLALLVVAVFLVGFQGSGNRRGGGGGGEDYSQRDTCYGYWPFNDASPTYASGAADLCTTSAQKDDDTLVRFGDPVQTCASGLPVGTASGECYAELDGASDFFGLFDGIGAADDFDGLGGEITFGCWAYQTTDGNNPVFDQSLFDQRIYINSASGWTAAVDSGFGSEMAATNPVGSQWYHMVVTFSNSGDGLIKAYLDGVIDCAGPCNAGSTPNGGSYLSIGEIGGATARIRVHECAWMAEELSAEEVCQWCRCGYIDNATDRDAACGSCSLGALECSN